MAKKLKLLQRIINSQRNVRFKDFIALVEAFGFTLDRVRGSHFIYVHNDVDVLLNIQDVKGQAKPYQVRQFLQMIEHNNLTLGE